jgi:hypothetical protein
MRRSWRLTAASAYAPALAIAVCLPALLAGAASASFSTSAEPTTPQLTDVTQSASVWREGERLAVISTHAPVGTTFSFTLNQRAQVTFTFVPTYSGRRVCTIRHEGASTVRTCRRATARSTLSFFGHAGRNHLRFFGRVSQIATLARATYRLTITARNATGALAQPATLRFTIVA